MSDREALADAANTYSSWIGAVYIFNLIVGTGALTIPAAFGQAGWLLGTAVIIVLAFISYVTTTFTIEAMAAANAIIQWKKLEHALVNRADVCEDGRPGERDDDATSQDETGIVEEERAHLLDGCDESEEMCVTPKDFYDIENKVEMGQMAIMFFNKAGLILFYVIISVYLYGDLAIYGAAVSKTLRDVTCTYFSQNVTCDPSLAPTSPCWPGISISRGNAYRLYLAAFVLLVGPFVFSNVQKTKALQIFTSLLRWTSFGMMVILASIHLSKGAGKGHPPLFRWSGLPNLFGVCIYSFMCHHSLPSLVAPIADKSKIHRLMAFNYAAILLFYLLVALTAVFGFDQLRDLYTLNFEPDRCKADGSDLPTDSVFVQYFLSLFPVFTLTTNFPIIGITLRNNLSQGLSVVRKSADLGRIGRIGFPLLAVVPPALVSLTTENLQVLVGVTGSFAGAGVQYVIPAMLVACAQRTCRTTLGTGIKNRHRSPFRHKAWIAFTLLWTFACVAFIITNYVVNGVA